MYPPSQPSNSSYKFVHVFLNFMIFCMFNRTPFQIWYHKFIQWWISAYIRCVRHISKQIIHLKNIIKYFPRKHMELTWSHIKIKNPHLMRQDGFVYHVNFLTHERPWICLQGTHQYPRFDFIECFKTTFLRAHSWLNWVDEDDDEDEVGLKEKPEDTRYIKKITSK